MMKIRILLIKDSLRIFPTEYLQSLLLRYGQNMNAHFNENISFMVATNRHMHANVHTQLSKTYRFGSRLTVVSRKAKKKQYACASSSLCDHYSE